MSGFTQEQTYQELLAAQEGDAAAIDSLFRRYHPITCRIVAAKMGVQMGILLGRDDVVQGALMRAFRGLDGFEYKTEGAFRRYLSRLVENELSDQWRLMTALKRGAVETRPLEDGENHLPLNARGRESSPSPSEVVRGRELWERLQAALPRLSERQRQVFVLHHPDWCGLSHAEVATELGISSEATARSLYSRALIQLSEYLEEK